MPDHPEEVHPERMGEHLQPQPTGRRFSIWVMGRLSEGFAEDIGAVASLDPAGQTVLTGELIDQSQIYGILDHLRQLGIEVQRFETNQPNNPKQALGAEEET